MKIHQGKIRAFLVRLCKNYDLADDIAQDTFLNAFRKLSNYKGDGSFQGWLFRIAYNNFLQHKRSANRRSKVTEEYAKQYLLIADNYESISAEQIDLEKAMATLNRNEVAAITLCHSYGFSHQEVASILKTPLGTIKTNINRGKSKLRKMLYNSTTIESKMEKVS